MFKFPRNLALLTPGGNVVLPVAHAYSLVHTAVTLFFYKVIILRTYAFETTVGVDAVAVLARQGVGTLVHVGAVAACVI